MMRWTRLTAVWGLATTVWMGQLAAEDLPKLEELGPLLVKQSETLNQCDVTYRNENKYLFPVAGLTPKDLTTGINGQFRTVFKGRKRRCEFLADAGNSEIVIFDGTTSAEMPVKRSQLRPIGVSVSLRQGCVGRANNDCQCCLHQLRKPLSDSTLASAYDLYVFPWNFLLALDPEKRGLIQMDAQPTTVNNSRCCVVRIGDGFDNYWLDLDHGFALVRRERFDLYDGKRFLSTRSTASDFRQHGERWIPYSYEREHFAPPSAKENAGQVYFKVKMNILKIQLEDVSDEAFKVELVDGAPIFDADKQRQIQNRATNLTEVGDLVAKIQSAHRPWWHWTLGIVVVSAVAVALWRWKKGDRHVVTKSLVS